MSIAAQMREASAQDHKNAESMRFVQQLMGGVLSSNEYVAYLTQLAHVYRALESKLADIDVLPFSTSLLRLENILRDLKALGAEDWESVAILKSTTDYGERLAEIRDHHDIRLVAHHYTRYLGDLSGGQAIGSLVRRHYGLTEEQTTFYKFDQIKDIVRFKESYRDSLDALLLDEEQLNTLLAEVQVAFRLNQALFAELGELTPALQH